MLYFEQGSTVAVGNVLGEGQGSTVQVVAVGSLLEIAVGILLVFEWGTSLGVVLGSQAAVQGEAEDKVHNLGVVDLMDKVVAVHMVLEVVEVLENMVEEDQLWKQISNAQWSVNFQTGYTTVYMYLLKGRGDPRKKEGERTTKLSK